MFKFLNFIFPSLFFKIKSRGGLIGAGTHVTYPYKIAPTKKNRKNFLKIGNNVRIGKGFWISMIDEYKNNSYEPYLEIGDGCSFGEDMTIGCCSKVKIGKNVLAAARVLISDTTHEYANIEIPPIDQPLSKGLIDIGDNCFLGINSCIINCKLGRHVIVGANAVVTKDVPKYSIIAGAPAKIIKKYNFDTKKWEKTME